MRQHQIERAVFLVSGQQAAPRQHRKDAEDDRHDREELKTEIPFRGEEGRHVAHVAEEGQQFWRVAGEEFLQRLLLLGQRVVERHEIHAQ
jgi:hypothetical protein